MNIRRVLAWRHRESDRAYAQKRFFSTFHRELDLSRPTTFNEKIQWLKLYQRKREYTALADKLLVRNYVERKIGSEHLIPLLRIYRSAHEIRLEELPEKFILKANNGCARNLICFQKSSFDLHAAQQKIDNWLHDNYYHAGREWVYKNIKPRILCEQLLESPDQSSILDYKFFCFSGVAKVIQVDVDRHTYHKRCFFDMDWNRLPFSIHYPATDRAICRPEPLAHMIAISQTLAQGFPFLRIDLYNMEGRVFFGEITFYPGNGFEVFHEETWDQRLGSMIVLPEQMK